MSPALDEPVDRRRFPFYARQREIVFELAEPGGAYDIVVLSPRADIVGWARLQRGTRLVFDLTDPYLTLPRGLRSRLRGIVKFAAGEITRPTLDYVACIARMCERADAVVVTSATQRDQAAKFNDRVHEILDAHEDLITRRKVDYSIGGRAELVWEGLPYNVHTLREIMPALDAIDREIPVQLRVVSAPTYTRVSSHFWSVETERRVATLGPTARFHPWSETTLAETVTRADMAVIPLPLDRPFMAGKSAQKLILMWHLGVPTLTSPTPAYEAEMRRAGLEMTCRATDDWRAALLRFLTDENARAEAGQKARRYAEEHHGTEAVLARWDAAFESALGST